MRSVLLYALAILLWLSMVWTLFGCVSVDATSYSVRVIAVGDSRATACSTPDGPCVEAEGGAISSTLGNAMGVAFGWLLRGL